MTLLIPICLNPRRWESGLKALTLKQSEYIPSCRFVWLWFTKKQNNCLMQFQRIHNSKEITRFQWWYSDNPRFRWFAGHTWKGDINATSVSCSDFIKNISYILFVGLLDLMAALIMIRKNDTQHINYEIVKRFLKGIFHSSLHSFLQIFVLFIVTNLHVYNLNQITNSFLERIAKTLTQWTH